MGNLQRQRVQPFIRRSTVETPIQPEEPFIGLNAQMIHLDRVVAQRLEPLEKLELAVLFQGRHVSLGTSGVFGRTTPGARDTAW